MLHWCVSMILNQRERDRDTSPCRSKLLVLLREKRERRGDILSYPKWVLVFLREKRETEKTALLSNPFNFDHIRPEERESRQTYHHWLRFWKIEKENKNRHALAPGLFETEKLTLKREDVGKKATRSRPEGTYTPCPDRHARHETSRHTWTNACECYDKHLFHSCYPPETNASAMHTARSSQSRPKPVERGSPKRDIMYSIVPNPFENPTRWL